MDQRFIEKKRPKNEDSAEKTRLPGGQARILVAPLDWGLGHATRCIPIIHELLRQGCDVWLAGEGAQQELLLAEFPHIPFLPLPGYRIRYSKTKRSFLWKMLRQAPRFTRTIKAEHEWLKKMVTTHAFDAVISDNRYGLWHPSVPCIFITHQLLIKSPFGKWTERLLQKRNYRYINRFTACWIPDHQASPSLAGDLSHPSTLPTIPIHYTGPLSRLKKEDTPVQKDHLLFLLSGPEPQRTILENKIIQDIGTYPYTATIVRGLPGNPTLIPSSNMIRFYNHLPAAELNKEMETASLIIGRSGYSSVMDIMALQKKSVLIPTPGQTEQEYLGIHLQQNGLAAYMPQETFSLVAVLKTAGNYTYQLTDGNKTNSLASLISNFLASCKTNDHSVMDLG